MSATIAPPLFFQQFNPNNSGAPAIGYKLFTYEAGTTTKQATWTDSTQGTENTNPIILDSNGGANVWGDPTMGYKLVWAPPNDTDPPSSPIRAVDNVYFPLTIEQITQALIGQTLYPLTTRETGARVTPTNYAYPPGDLRRYGAAGDGSTDDSAAIRSAFETGHQVLGGGPQYTYLYTSNISIPAGVSIRFDGQGCALKPSGSSLIDNANIAAVATTTVSSGATIGSISIVVASASNLAIGQLVQIGASNMPTTWARIKGLSGATLTLDTALPVDYSGTINLSSYYEPSWYPQFRWENCTFDGSALTSVAATLGQCLRIVNVISGMMRNVEVTNFSISTGTNELVLIEFFMCLQVSVQGCHWHDNPIKLGADTTAVALECDDSGQVSVVGNVMEGSHFGINVTRAMQAVASSNILRGQRTYESSISGYLNNLFSVRGIKISSTATAHWIGNEIDDYASPIKCDSGFRALISGNSIRNQGVVSGTSNTDACIEITTNNGANQYGFSIIGNVVENGGGCAILVNSYQGATAKGLVLIQGNVIRRTQDSAILVANAESVIAGNIIMDWDLANTSDPAVIYGDGATIASNSFWHTVSSTKACMSSSFTSQYRYVLRDNKSPTGNPLFSAGTNIGVDTFGTGQISSAATSVIITHNALRTPSLDEISIVSSALTSNSLGFSPPYITAITSTTFTVHVAAAPGAGGFNFAWRVNLRQPWTAP